MIDDSVEQNGGPFIHELTKPSQKALDRRIKKALQESGLEKKKGELEDEKKTIEIQLKEEDLDKDTRKILDARLDEVNKLLDDIQKRERDVTSAITQDHVNDISNNPNSTTTQTTRNDGGGCFPGSAIFVDKRGRQRSISSLQNGEEVQVITNSEIRWEPVITFIHCQPQVMQEFLKITTIKNNVLKITEDHLLFVEKTGQATAIPARDLEVGDTVYVRGKHSVETDAVQSISTVYEKGVYAPVTLSGTILVNDVHTSCYFDVLSHEWSHRAMGVARAVHYVSPWMLQWISGVGQKDGFPGWCRLAHKMLTLLD